MSPLVWFLQAFEYTSGGFRNVADVYSKACKNQTNGDLDLKYGLKLLVGCILIDLGG